jgi:hypothetical protein
LGSIPVEERKEAGRALNQARRRVETMVDPDRAWGRVRGRWRYPDRPSWWARWESADQLLWQPADEQPSWQEPEGDRGSLQRPAVDLTGDMIDITGPLS